MDFSRRHFFNQLSLIGAGVLLTSPGLAFAKKLSASDKVLLSNNAIDLLTIDDPNFDATTLLNNGMTSLVIDFRFSPKTFAAADTAIDMWNKKFSEKTSKILKVSKAEDFVLAKQQKKLGVVLCTQYAPIFGPPVYSKNESNLDNLEHFYKKGLRVVNLTHNDSNGVGGGYWDQKNFGLSRLGEALVDKMNELGVIIDLSHCSDATTNETLERSKKPCVFSHTGCRSLYDSPRNKSDQQIKMCADKGGLVGIYNITAWLTTAPKASLEPIIKHIKKVVDLAGVEHVGFGSDGPAVKEKDMDKKLDWFQNIVIDRSFPGNPKRPNHMRYRPLDSEKRMLVLADGLKKQGFKEAEIDKILGTNFVRVFKEVCG